MNHYNQTSSPLLRFTGYSLALTTEREPKHWRYWCFCISTSKYGNDLPWSKISSQSQISDPQAHCKSIKV
jgi:hypothetical protein